MIGADTSWILTSTALVLIMTLPGLALFYGGLVRSSNILSVLIQCFAIACLASILWLVAGYSIAFSGEGAYIGDLKKVFLRGVGTETTLGNLPENVFFMFQMTFAVITPALIVGAYVERIKFSAVLWISGLWLLLVYAPVTHWIWGGGWLAKIGVQDFAGGLVVHLNCGMAALVIAKMLGSRKGFPNDVKPPHSPVLVFVGAAMLWVGWFGFNGGSVLSADPALTSLTLVTTCLAAAAGGIGAAVLSGILYKNLDLTMFMNGVLGGLVGITAGADQMLPHTAILIGLIAGGIVVLSVALLDKCKLDDPVGAIPVHLFCGIWGTLAVGLFGELAGFDQFMVQLACVGITAVFCVIGGTIITLIVKSIAGLRVDEKEEEDGLDIAEHGTRAYGDFSIN